jgi:ABC-type multidrug transport system fused ATPase/permease subunit
MTGFGEKLGQAITAFSSLFAGVILGVITGPVFGAIGICYIPFFLICIFKFGKIVGEATKAKIKRTAALNAHTEETFSALRLVFAFA